MNLLTIEHLTKSYTERLLFNDTAFCINEGEKVGLIGINGTGKSTLAENCGRSGGAGRRYGCKAPQNSVHPLSAPDPGVYRLEIPFWTALCGTIRTSRIFSSVEEIEGQLPRPCLKPLGD